MKKNKKVKKVLIHALTFELKGFKLDAKNNEGGQTKLSMKYAKLRGRIVEKYGSISAFTEKLDITLTQVSKKLNGVSGFSQEDIVEWAKLLEIDIADVGAYFFS